MTAVNIPELTLLIPTYNEADQIEPALDAIQSALGPDLTSTTEVIVVDDGKDSLPMVVNRIKNKYNFFSLEVFRNNPGLGKGKSLALGFSKARATVSGFMDVDLSTPPRYIMNALSAIRGEGYDIFIGSRKAPGAKVTRIQPMAKDILGHMLGVVARGFLFYGNRNYQDTQCGFKFYRTRIARVLYSNLVAPDGLNDLEVLMRANSLGCTVKEQGVEWTDLRESKRSLRRILLGEIKAVINIVLEYKIFAAKNKIKLLELMQAEYTPNKEEHRRKKVVNQ